MPRNNSKVLVTGANGFIGSVLCNELKLHGFNVRTLNRTPCSPGMDDWMMDLATNPCDPELCRNIDTIFHLAGKAHALAETAKDEELYRQINTEGTRKLLEAAQQAGVRRFIFFSSVKAVGETEEQPMDETVGVPADTPYGESKFAAEQLVLYGGYVPHPVVIRPCMVYGNSEKGNLPRMIKAIRRGVFPPLPETNNRRSMVHVKDLARAALLAAEKPEAAGQIYVVSDEQNYSTRQLYDLIRTALGKPPIQWAIPFGLIAGLAKTGDAIGRISGRRFVFNSQVLHKLTGSACYSSAKIRRELGFSPAYTLPQTLPNIIHYLNSI